MSKRGAPDVVGQSGSDGVQASGALPLATVYELECTILLPHSFSVGERSEINTDKYFSPTRNFQGFTQEFDLAPRHEVTPIRHAPGNYIKQSLSEVDERISLDGSRILYMLSNGTKAVVTVHCDEFSDCNFVVRLKLHASVPFADISEVSTEVGFILRDITSPAFRKILNRVISLVCGTKGPAPGRSGRISLHTKIEVPLSEERVAEYLSRNAAELVALHISRDPLLIPDPRLSAAVLRAGDELNLKSESQLLLVNAQGSTLFAAGTTARPTPFYHNRYERVADLFEIAHSMQQDLLYMDRGMVARDNMYAPYASGLPFRSWIFYPMNVFHTSVSNQKIWDVVSDALYLKSIVNEIADIGGDIVS